MDQPTLTAPVGFDRARAARFRAVAAEIARDWPLLAVVVAYAFAVGMLCAASGKPQFFRPFVYMPVWIGGLVIGSAIYAILFELRPAIRTNPASPLSALVQRLSRHMTPRVAAAAVLFTAAGVFTGTFSDLKSVSNMLVPFHADLMLADVDAALHLGVDPWRWLQPMMGHHAITRLIQALYMNGWMVMLLGFVGAAAFAPRLAHVRTRFFVVYFISWIVLGNLMATTFMSGGPAFYGLLTGDHGRFSEQLSYLSFSEGVPRSSATVQKSLWAIYNSGELQLGSGISAFPSMHVAMTTLFTLTAFQLSRWAGWAAAGFGALILTGSVHLGWHYAIDGYASMAFVTALWFGVGRATARKSSQAAARVSGP